MATSNNNVIISRIQNRRGLKQDLPQPLRAGEIGLATDSKQVFIGADTDDATSSIHNKSLTFEKTTGAKDTTKSIANNQIIAFTVPHIRYPKGTFDGVTKTASYTPSTSKSYTLSDGTNEVRTVFNANVANSYVLSISSNLSFKAQEINVIKNGVELTGQNTPTIAGVPDSGYDYVFNANTSTSNTHTVSFRVAPDTTDEIGISYYGNTSVIRALDGFNGANTQIHAGATTQNFYDRYGLAAYRQIPTKYIRVSSATGKGYIGLQYKHIAVTADSVGVIDTSSLNFGDLLVSRDSMITNSAVISASGSTATITLPSGHLYSNTSIFDTTYIQNADATDWINNKAVQVSNVQPTAMDITLPSANAWQTSRDVTTAASDGSVTTITGDTEGLITGHYVRFRGNNSTPFGSTAYEVQSVGVGSFTVTKSGIGVITTNLFYINYGTTDGNNVQITSAKHGLPASAPVTIAGSTDTGNIANGSKTTASTLATTNTFFVPTTSQVYANVTGTFAVQLVDSAISHTPVRSMDLSSATTLEEASAVVGGFNDDQAYWSLNITPDTTNSVYFTHKEANSSVPVDYHLHEDAVGTLSELKLTAGSYDKTSTVKAKLENFLNDLLLDPQTDLLYSVDTNQQYNTGSFDSTPNLGTYNLDIDETFNEMDFNSRGEARDFSYILNSLYYEKSGTSEASKLKGLVNLKTNIELLTSQGAASMTSTSSFDTPDSATLSSANTAQNILALDITNGSPAYDSFIIDYSVNFAGVSSNYQRIGTLYVTGYNNSGGTTDVSISDRSSEVTDLSGTIQFSATISGNTITVTGTHTIGQSLKFNYLTRRWNSR